MLTYHAFKLPNGLQVVHTPTKGKSQVFVTLAVRAGSIDEGSEQKGLAHFLEHMLFKRSKHIPNYIQAAQKIGAQVNAMTYFDTTYYMTSASKSDLASVFWLESDRFFFPQMTAEAVRTEQQVVIEELNQQLFGAPYQDWLMHLLPTAFQKHTPLSWHIIGSEAADIERINLRSLEAFQKRFYTPSNSVLLIDGDLDSDEVEEMATKWFNEEGVGRADGRRLIQLKPASVTDRVVCKEIRAQVPNTRLLHAYYLPPKQDAMNRSIALTANLLGAKEDGLLYTHLVKSLKCVRHLQIMPLSTLYGGLLVCQYDLEPGVSYKQVEESTALFLAELMAKEIPLEKLERFKKNMIVQFKRHKEIPYFNQQQLAYGYFIGNLEYMAEAVCIGVPKIDFGDVKKVLQQLLSKEQRTTLVYLPND